MKRSSFTFYIALAVSLAVFAAAPYADGAGQLIGHYRLDSASGGTTPDASTTGNTGVITGSPGIAPGVFGSSFQFGSGDIVEITDVTPGLSGFTYSAWVQTNNTSNGTQEIIGNWTTSRSLLRFTGSGDLDGHIQNQSGSQRSVFDIDQGETDFSNFRHVALTFDGQNLRGYLDGSLNDTDSYAGGGNTVEGGTVGTLAIGGRVENSGGHLIGRLDDVAIWDAALNTGEINALINLGTQAELNYDASVVDSLFQLYDAGAGAAPLEIGNLEWSYTTGLAGTPGDLFGGGDSFALILGVDGSGLLGINPPLTPEPSSLILFSAVLSMFGVWGYRRNRKLA